MYLVSIIIPFYNSAAVLAETIESAIRQTYSPKEIILVDDGSTDSSFELARQYEGEQVRVIRQENAGAAVARNTGLTASKGDYIQFLDAGDLLSETKIAVQVAALHGRYDQLAVCNYAQFSTGDDLSRISIKDQTAFIFSSDKPVDFLINLWGGTGKSYFIQTNSWLLPRKLIENAGSWRAYRCPDDDGEFFARMVLASKGVVCVQGVLNYYRVESGSNMLSGNKSKQYLHNTLLTILLKEQYIAEKGGHAFAARAFARQYLDFAVYNYPHSFLLSALSYRRYQLLGIQLPTPVLGHPLLEQVRKMAGWKAARLIRYLLRERKH